MDQGIGLKLKELFIKYRIAAIILLIGILMMTLSVPKKESSNSDNTIQTETTLEDKLSDILSQVAGAGEVKVLLTQSSGAQSYYQADTRSGENAQSESTVVITDKDRNQNGLIARIDPPVYSGAVILSEGADQPEVRLALTKAAATAAGLRFNQITVLKMK